MAKSLKRTSTPRTTTIGEGRFLRLAKRGKWEFCERHGSSGVVGIIATTKGGKLILVEQWREPVGAKAIELPAGLVGDAEDDEGESSVAAALRELEEETGYHARNGGELVVSGGCVSAGMTSERVDLVRAKGVKKIGPGGGVDGEDITVHSIPLKKVPKFLERSQADGCTVDFKVWAALWLVSQE